MEAENVGRFRSLSENVGRFKVRNKTFLIPQMNRIGAHLIAGAFRGFGVKALVMDTYEALDLGKEFTSGKECFPCQITTGDILHFMKKEKEKLGGEFDPEEYIYFMPEAGGPCRFGMYNKYQRIVLDSFPDFKKLKIAFAHRDYGRNRNPRLQSTGQHANEISRSIHDLRINCVSALTVPIWL